MTADTTRLTVNLHAQAGAALDTAAKLCGDDQKTDTLNRAVQTYMHLADAAASAPTRGTGFTTIVVENLLGDGVAYDIWVRRAR